MNTPDFRSLHGDGVFSFLRHGESQGNAEGVVQGRLPSHLTGAGREQARAAGRWYRERKPHLVLCSPLGRAHETAAIVAAEAGLDGVTPMEELTEIDTGAFTGLTIPDCRARHPDTYREFQQHSWDAVPGAETSADLYRRALVVWDTLLDHFRVGRTSVLCVTHSGFLQWIIRSTLGWSAWMPLFDASLNCHVTELTVRNADLGDGRWGHFVNWTRVNAQPG